jgi:hypothetical protein
MTSMVDAQRLRALTCTLPVAVALGCSLDAPPPPDTAVAQAEPQVAVAQEKLRRAPEAPEIAAPRLVIREAKLSLKTPSPQALIDRSAKLARSFGGFVVSSETSHIQGKVVKAEVSLRVRAEHLDTALAELRKLGEVLRESVTGEDVSAEFVDVQARLKAKRVLEERLLAIATEAKAVEDMLKVETELSRVRADIEKLEGRSHLLSDRARLSLIQVTAQSPSQPTAPEAQSFGSKLGAGFERAVQLSGEVLIGLVVVAGAIIPLAVALASVVVPLLWWRRRRRRRAAAALGQRPGPSDEGEAP